MDSKRITAIHTMATNPSLLELIYRQIAEKDHKSNSWIIATHAILGKYGLPHIIDVIESHLTKEARKTELDRAT